MLERAKISRTIKSYKLRFMVMFGLSIVLQRNRSRYIYTKVATEYFNNVFYKIYSPNSSIFGYIPNISIWYSVCKRIYLVK